jgi:hypothetical protein
VSCPKIPKCALYPKFMLRLNLDFWKTHYCKADYTLCERYRQSEAGTKPADDLLPDGKTLKVTLRPDDVSGDDE